MGDVRGTWLPGAGCQRSVALAASAAGSFLLAFFRSSRSSKRRGVTNLRSHRCDTLDDSETSSSSGLAPEAHPPGMGATRPASGPAPLLLHGLLSLALIQAASLWHPASIALPHDVWRQLIGSLALAAFLAHILLFYVIAPARRRRAAAATTARRVRGQEATSRQSAAQIEAIRALNGTWIKDKTESDSLTPVCDLMRLNAVLRMAIGMIRGVELQVDEVFALNVLTPVRWFKIKERWTLSGGEEARHRRRDFRGGGSFAMAAPAREGGVEVRHRWGAPLAGTMQERFWCPEPGVLHVQTRVEVPERGPALSYTEIYRKTE